MHRYGDSAEVATEMVMEKTEANSDAHRAPRWHRLVALSTLVFALLAAVGALLAGITAHEAVLERTEQAIEISVLEGDRVTIEIVKAQNEILASLGQAPDPEDIALIEAYNERVAELSRETEQEEDAAQEANSSHLTLAIAVTILSVGITLCGMSIVADQRWLWVAGLLFGLAGAVGLGIGLLSMMA